MFGWLSNLFSSSADGSSTMANNDGVTGTINPGSGLPMANSAVDVAGNPWGTGSLLDSSSSISDTIGNGMDGMDSSSSSMFDDSSSSFDSFDSSSSFDSDW